ncbi:MAG TPA: short-chain dehydrogenase/reductase [Solirubrobacteraceae bacterium]|jgi:NAD(P)-dependent dehydrogenase (short-subunit alcohol dehydrogenase family)|nr:short-chain dehydrogenase/reductase [Solirubrobacteraceae bacterium]
MNGKTVFITGAARGIGADAARRLARAGANVALAGLEPEELERVAAGCSGRALAVEADVTDAAALEAAVAATVERFGAIDAVFANAGIGSGGLMHRVDSDAFERVVEVNLLGAWRTVHATLPHLLASRGYLLINASMAQLVNAFPLMGSYAAAKAGVEALGNTLRLELRHHGVDVGVAYFSWIGSDLVRGADSEHPAFKRVRDEMRGPLGKTYPVEVAGRAAARGVQRRSRIVVGPWWVRAMLPLRGLLTRPAELQLGPLMPEVERLMEAEERERGADAFTPVGAGGRADARAQGRVPA